MRPQRILFVTTGLGTGGAEHMLCKIIEAAPSQQVQFMVVSLRDKGDFGARLCAAGIPFVCCELPKLDALWAMPRAIRQIKVFDPDVIQGWMYHGCFVATLFSWVLSKKPPVAWGIRQTLYDLSKERLLTRCIIWLQAKLSGSAARIVYNSELSRTQHRAVGFSNRFDEVLPNGFDLARYHPDDERRSKFRKLHSIGNDEILIGLVARLHPMKDHLNFFKAASIIAKSLPNVRFVLAGAGTNWPSVHEMLVDSGVADRVLCLGRFEYTEHLYPALDLVVLSSAWGEGWPNVLGEAMACGIPCVSTDVGASAEIIGEHGRIVPAADSLALANACIELLSSLSKANGLAARLRKSIATRFDINEIAGRYVAIWARLAHSSRNE